MRFGYFGAGSALYFPTRPNYDRIDNDLKYRYMKMTGETNFFNALDRIPKLIEQYQTENAKLEKDLPTLREIVGTWKKEDELKEPKSGVAALERKIQLTLAPPEQASKDGIEEKQKEKVAIPLNDDKDFIKEHIIISRPQSPAAEVSRGFKI